MKLNQGLVGAILFFLVPVLVIAEPKTLRVTEASYTHKEGTAPAIVIENEFYAATLVPDLGGRILRWVEKRSGTELVYDAGYGGLLDDHGARIRLPYTVEWLKQDATEAVVRLTLDCEIRYTKTLSFHADRPTIAVEYQIENRGQTPQRLLFRNVVRPGGCEFSDAERYCYSRVVGLQKTANMPRTDDQADPWCALVHEPTKLAVVNAFESDVLARLYTWQGSKIAPTYEFMFPQLDAGRRLTARYTWSFVHGLSSVDYAHRTFAAQIEGDWENGRLNVRLDLAGTWARMPDLTVAVEVLDAARAHFSESAPRAMPVATVGELTHFECTLDAPAVGDYAILILKLRSSVLGAEPVIIEKAFPAAGDRAKLTEYRRPVRWLGEPTLQEPIDDWEKEVAYTLQPNDADRARGYMVFDEIGKQAGLHTTALELDMAQNEPEAFPLHVHSLDRKGRVAVQVTAPKGIAVEIFVPELMPETLWGRTMNGLKLNPGSELNIVAGDDRLFYFRVRTETPPPGPHSVRLTFTLADAEPVEVELRVNVYPIRFPRRPFMVFDVNNVANYLCSRKIKGLDYVWDEERAHNYLADMAAHGVAGQSLGGVNAPNSHYWYSKVQVRDTGQTLTDAIKADPNRFRNRLDLPALDFAEWDWFVDRLVEHGMTHVRWAMGGTGSGFLQGHNQLTRLIYGRTFPDGDIRQSAVQEWYLREVTRYLKDRGIERVFGSIDDEIPAEKLAWWVQHAYRTLQMGLEPGVTQSAETLADDQRIHMVAPFMRQWIIGTLHKATLDKRRAEGIIRPEHWTTTYHSSANHWQPYAQMRGHCGMNPAYFDLDACWIQTYYRWNQSEAAIYPGETGPVGSAAWEGARDGLDDGNLLLLARAMIRALPDVKIRERYTDRLEEIVGERENSLVRFRDTLTGAGLVTSMERHDTGMFREAKKRLLLLTAELTPLVPVQKAGADFGLHTLIRDGVAPFVIPAGMALAPQVAEFLKAAADGLALSSPESTTVDPALPYPVLFAGTLEELRLCLPKLAQHPDLADLGANYPRAGGYVVRFVQQAPEHGTKNDSTKRPESMLILGGDVAGAEKALSTLSKMATPVRGLYSHWLLSHVH